VCVGGEGRSAPPFQTHNPLTTHTHAHTQPQMPSLHDARLSSLLGALMSAAYCVIAVGMSASVRPGPEVNYNPAAVQRSSTERVMGIFNALTTVFFAYGGVCVCVCACVRPCACVCGQHQHTVHSLLNDDDTLALALTVTASCSLIRSCTLPYLHT
jgi:hypothetical protein